MNEELKKFIAKHGITVEVIPVGNDGVYDVTVMNDRHKFNAIMDFDVTPDDCAVVAELYERTSSVFEIDSWNNFTLGIGFIPTFGSYCGDWGIEETEPLSILRYGQDLILLSHVARLFGGDLHEFFEKDDEESEDE